MTYNQHHQKEISIIQKKILQILNQDLNEIKVPVKFKIKAEISVDGEKLNWHDNFLSLIEPKIKGAKILDLFCGANSIKYYGVEKNLKCNVTGVDISDDKADLIADVAKIEKVLKPKKQFDLICNLAGIPNIANYEIIKKYLKDNGLFVTQSSDWVFNNEIQPILKNKSINPREDFRQETKQILKYFKPIIVVKILDIKNFTSIKASNYYIIWKNK